MTDVNDLRRKLETWQQRLLRVYGENHPYTAFARLALALDDDFMEDAVNAFCSDEALCKEIVGPARPDMMNAAV
jgi:hypothetical protein